MTDFFSKAGSFLILCAIAFPVAYFWIAFLIKIVMNDEEIQEQFRRLQRQREEQRREIEDRQKRRHKEQLDIAEGVEEKLKAGDITGSQPGLLSRNSGPTDA
ncbi:MAG: hypothetical protein JXR97_01675 [Planctomycetes bacterium]|nr:hypothetical protein [Planctomycetota bacterium]